ncbi:MAG: hypothetical protein ACREM3_12320 [Candidatus Rokuibacteriota bacterium]
MAQGKTAFLAQIGSAVVIALLVGGTAPWWWAELFGGTTPPPPPPPPKVAVKHVVTERNPFSGGVESTREFAEADRAVFTRECAERRKVHWVSWRYAGINEPLRSRRFATRAAAQRFVDDRGPQKMGTVPALTVLGEAAAVVAARVACDTVELPAPGARK